MPSSWIDLTNPAPESCFNHTFWQQPKNLFKVGMLVECADPTNRSIISIAIVKQVIGVRVKLGFIGCGTCDDFFALCDSYHLKPLGTAEKNGGSIQPSVHFAKHHHQFLKVVADIKTTNEIAPMECFQNVHKDKPVTSLTPFEVGQCLEVVDKKDKHMVSFGSIRSIDTGNVQMILIDTPVGTVKVPQNSRDIFPLGWAEENNCMVRDTSKLIKDTSKPIVPNSGPIIHNSDVVVGTISLADTPVKRSSKIDSDASNAKMRKGALVTPPKLSPATTSTSGVSASRHNAKYIYLEAASLDLRDFDMSSPVTDWTPNDVVRFLCRVDPIFHRFKSIFMNNEVDGVALMLLTHELVLLYLKLPYGAAVRLMKIISSLRV